MIQAIANGVVYTATDEHTTPNPMYKGATARALNATTGEEIWKLSEFPSEWGFSTPNQWATADGFSVFMNGLDNNVYSIGRGPSAMTVDAPAYATKLGDSIIIRGTVTDISAGTQQSEQAARFPNGVPAVSDENMGEWMGYVYQQKPRPTDTIGVPVTISVVDANGNYREIGAVTSNSDGFFTYNWKPDIEGQYTVYASFAGSESYWPSNAVTSFAVDSASATPTPQATQPTSMADQYFLPMSIVIIVAIAIVAALVVYSITRKHP
jgi:hypothetical protein